MVSLLWLFTLIYWIAISTKNSENSLNASHIAIDLALREAAFIILGVDVILLSKQQVPNPYEHEFRALPAVY